MGSLQFICFEDFTHEAHFHNSNVDSNGSGGALTTGALAATAGGRDGGRCGGGGGGGQWRQD